MSEWEFWLLSDKKADWILWTRGSMEDVMESYYDWHIGELRGYSAMRIERRKT